MEMVGLRPAAENRELSSFGFVLLGRLDGHADHQPGEEGDNQGHDDQGAEQDRFTGR